MVTNTPTYVRQPFPFSSIAADFTLKQNQILVEMLDVIRDKVEEFFRRGAADKMLFRAEDFDENGMAHIDVPLSSITPHPYEYNDIEEVATKILSAHMVYDDTDGKHIMNAFTEIVLPRTNGRRQGIVRFSFSKLQANKLFDFTRYSKFLKSVARNAKSSYTSTVYRDIEFHRFRGEWIADYKTLRQHLGCDIYDEKTKEWTVNKYGLYKNFKFRLLDVARKELKELADQGQVDCYFDYEEIYAGKVSLRHDPEKIRFIIHTTAMGELEDQKNKSQLRYIAIEQFLQDEFSLTSADVQSIVRLVSEDIYEQFDIRVKEIAKSVKRQGAKIDNVRLYALKALNNAIAEFTPPAEEVRDVKGNTPVDKQEEKHEEVKPAIPTLTDEQKAQWQMFKSKIRTELPHDRFEFWNNAIRLLSVTEDTIALVVPTKWYYDELSACFKKELFPSVKSVYGNINVTCKVSEQLFSQLDI